VILGRAELDGLGLVCDLRIVCGGAKIEEGLRRVCGAILVLLDHTVELLGLSSSAEDGGGRSPYSPPSILQSSDKPRKKSSCELWGIGGIVGNLLRLGFWGLYGPKSEGNNFERPVQQLW
jgi:hypothetical protein